MFVIGNRQISFAHITKIVWLDDQVDGVHPETGNNVKLYAFDVHTSYGETERMAYDVEEKRREEWEHLIDEMANAGY